MRVGLIHRDFMVELRATGEHRKGFLMLGSPLEQKPDLFFCAIEIAPVARSTWIFGPTPFDAVDFALKFANLRLEALRREFRFIDADGEEITTFSVDLPAR